MVLKKSFFEKMQRDATLDILKGILIFLLFWGTADFLNTAIFIGFICQCFLLSVECSFIQVKIRKKSHCDYKKIHYSIFLFPFSFQFPRAF